MSRFLHSVAIVGCMLIGANSGSAALPQLQPADGVIGGHEYVDLGLPSGLLWAFCNVGAETPFDAGYNYPWGQTFPAKGQTGLPGEYEHFLGVDSDYEPLFLDLGQNICGSKYDVASNEWGNGWRMPTTAEIVELMNHLISTPGYEQTWVESECKGVMFGDRWFLPCGLIGNFEDNFVMHKNVPFARYWAGTLTDFDKLENVPENVSVEQANYLSLTMSKKSPELSLTVRSTLGQIRPVYGPMNAAAVSESYFNNGSGWAGIAGAVADAQNVTIVCRDGRIVVSGVAEGSAVSLYDLAGRQVFTGIVADSGIDLPALTPGVYIATAAGKSVKVRM